jgi:membrane-associated phospholipid phosphatase
VTRASTQALALALLIAGRAAAQAPDVSSSKTFFTGRDGAIAAGFLAASVGLSVFDARIAHWFRDTTLAHVRFGDKWDDVFTHVNETTLTVGGLAVYAVAKLGKADALADVAFHTAESVAAASLTAQVIRGPLGRTRPRDTERSRDPQYEFHFFKGFTHFQERAFPSIHSSSGFAAASAIVAEVKHREPGAVWYVAVPAYALALTPGLSRMYLGQHWASDIFAGAFLGTFYGWRVVDYSHAHPTTRVDRIFLGSVQHAQIDVQRGSLTVGWSTAF